MRRLSTAGLLCALVACGKLFAHKDAGTDAAAEAGECPRPIHGGQGVGYCRGRCRNYAQRTSSHHARRVANPARWALGTCGKLKVFSEVNAKDAGVTEFFDESNQLVGAVDTLTPDCPQYGSVPECTPSLTWTTLDAGAPPPAEEDEDPK